ncbi:hypothetical protein A6A08_16920 [Nocardiopsis sp. TSRI0078]|uniref:hypothetical protein n=1 Tax=unclassified Nocardiopsis TaxID=2649073 RepID=UPI00093EF131|nr:hypothetical protein [Nocardiopsis sp. TSRI0078]OKI12256.1 hypothetical protein A6A08_16920 [Nocardiopsis sp. TSRI0078]
MEHLLLSVHVLAAIVFVGGSAVATSLFPRFAPVAGGVPASVAGDTADPAADTRSGARSPGERNPAVAALLHRITRGYAVAGVTVPVAGIALALFQGRMGEIWVTVAMLLTAAAGILLAAQIHPRQRDALREPGDPRELRTLSMLAGIYNLVWAVVVVLMIVRPGAAE